MNEKIKKHMPLFIIILVILLAAYFMSFAPKLRQVGDNKRMIASIDQEMMAKAPLDQELRGGVSYIKEKGVTFTLSTEGEVPFVTGSFIKNMLKGLSLDLSFFEPQQILSEGEYKRFPIRVGFNSNYNNFLGFLAKLRELKTQLRIDSLTVAKTQNEGKLAVQMDFSIFLLPGSSRVPDIKFPTFSFNPFIENTMFRPVATTIEAAEGKGVLSLNLQGVMLGDVNKAIINDRFVEEGQVIEGYKIKKIETNRVVLFKNGENYDLFLGGKYEY